MGWSAVTYTFSPSTIARAAQVNQNFTDSNGNAEKAAPTGSGKLWFANSSAPSGWLLCDGSAVSRTTYARLFAIIGTTWGAGDGSTTFNLPNLKGRVLVGLDSAQTEFDAVGETGGEKAHTLTGAESGVAPHGHGIRFRADRNVDLSVNSGKQGWAGTAEGSIAANTNLLADASAADASEAHNNLQPYAVAHYIIKD